MKIKQYISPEEQSITQDERKGSGAFFTPLSLACQMIRHFKLHLKWAAGHSFLDPTAGNGILLEALIKVSLENNIQISQEMKENLFGIEKEKKFTINFIKRIKDNYNITLCEHTIICKDLFLIKKLPSVSIIFGNPPWVNFNDLNDKDKEFTKPFFTEYNLMSSPKDLLLGSSRIDLAALVIAKVIKEALKAGGEAYFFIPLSLLLNEGAHNHFRKNILYSQNFNLKEILDFQDPALFPGIGTRSGFIYLEKKSNTKESIPYTIFHENKSIEKFLAKPINQKGSALHCYSKKEDLGQIPEIIVEKKSFPRQGINTCGKNSLYIFTHREEINPKLSLLKNKEREVILPTKFIYPLVGNKQFKGQESISKYILLPYTSDGKCLAPDKLKQYPQLNNYLMKHQKELSNRRGTIIQSSIKRGFFYALLGVGPYTFSSYKIIWEAFGKKQFKPRLFDFALIGNCKKCWIPNQSLQASSSFDTKKDAEIFLKKLNAAPIEKFLKSQNMEGTCNWAQPGRIKIFLKES